MKLEQIVNFPTTSQHFIVTNLHDFYNTPHKRPPFGLSDYCSIDVKSKSRSLAEQAEFKVKSRGAQVWKRRALFKSDIATHVRVGKTC